MPIPGASAVLAAARGVRALPGRAGRFEGFLPRSGARAPRAARAHRRRRSRRPSSSRRPRRAAATLARPGRRLRRRPPGRPLPRADQAPRGDRPRHARRAGGGDGRRADRRRGEVTLVVGAAAADTLATEAAVEAGVERLAARPSRGRRLVADGSARGDAARQVAATSGLPRRELYGSATPDRPADRAHSARPGRRRPLPSRP